MDPGRFFINKERIKSSVVGIQDEFLTQIHEKISAYDPKKELLFFVFTCPPKGGTQAVLQVV